MREQISAEEAHARMKAQGVSGRDHIAFKCPSCGTVQSMASLLKAGDTPDMVERHVGFSCEGRLTGAGPWPSHKDKSARSFARRSVRGCDWSLGGLFQIHRLEIDGHPSFEIASPDEAKMLEQRMTAAAVPA